MPAIPTGSPPVALTPVPAHEFGPRSHPGSSQANRDPLVYASTNAQASSHGHGVTGLASTSPTPFPTPNPHSLRALSGAPLTAISCLGAFRTPASRARARFVFAGIRKPAHEQTFARSKMDVIDAQFETRPRAVTAVSPGFWRAPPMRTVEDKGACQTGGRALTGRFNLDCSPWRAREMNPSSPRLRARQRRQESDTRPPQSRRATVLHRPPHGPQHTGALQAFGGRRASGAIRRSGEPWARGFAESRQVPE